MKTPRRITSQSSTGCATGKALTHGGVWRCTKPHSPEHFIKRARIEKSNRGICQPPPLYTMYGEKMTKKQKRIAAAARLEPPKKATLAEWDAYDRMMEARK